MPTCMYLAVVPAVGGPVMPTAGPPSPPLPPSAEDRVEPITGFKTVMVHTMTESGEKCTCMYMNTCAHVQCICIIQYMYVHYVYITCTHYTQRSDLDHPRISLCKSRISSVHDTSEDFLAQSSD